MNFVTNLKVGRHMRIMKIIPMRLWEEKETRWKRDGIFYRERISRYFFKFDWFWLILIAKTCSWSYDISVLLLSLSLPNSMLGARFLEHLIILEDCDQLRKMIRKGRWKYFKNWCSNFYSRRTKEIMGK